MSVKKVKVAVLAGIFLISAISLAMAAPLPCKVYEPGCDQNFFKHYESLNSAIDKLLKAHPELTKDLGEEIETAYHGVWLQRYETGEIVHISQFVPFTKVKLESHEGSTFVIRFDDNAKDKGKFFYQWTPKVTGIYDVDLFKSILISYPRDPGLIGWPQGDKIPDPELIEMFRPHTESSPKNLSGGLAVMYAMYRLDQYIGRPLEQQFTRTILRKNYKNGYILIGMPDPNPSPNNVNDVKFAYIFKTEKEPKGNSDTDRFAGGKRFRAGSWHILEINPGKAEQQSRPKRGLFRD